nr:MAG: hypothetical protein 3 [Leviviridae sp.]
MKSLMLLWQEFARNLGDECSVCTVRDVETLTKRTEHEGSSFLAITLPQFAKDFEKSLAAGCIDRSSFQGHTWRGGLPAFLGGFLDLVFVRSTGRLLDDPSVAAIHAIRQLTMLFGKVEAPASEKRLVAAIEGYVECEQEVRENDNVRPNAVNSDFERVSHLLFGDLLERVDRSLFKEQRCDWDDKSWPYIHPKHGPGATADRLGGNAKFDLSEWPSRLENVFPYGEYGIPNPRYYYRYSRVDLLEPGRERAAKLVDVPKTVKTPRLIAKEPSAMQYMQQALQPLLVSAIKRDPLVGRIIGFDDQEANHRLARIGSLSGDLATLDLSEASDRVSNQLVRAMFSRWFHVAEAVDATRSRSVDVPGKGNIRLAKFASMGSALTFPVEAMVFTAVVFVGIERVLNHRLTRADIKSLKSMVRVYGDDIIVPVRFAESVVRSLEDFGLKVNVSKSFWTGKFRESCGKDYYDGHDVSVVRVRHVVVNPDGKWALPTQRRHVQESESLVSLRNRCYAGGLWGVAAWLDQRINSLLSGMFPVVSAIPDLPDGAIEARASGLVRWSVLGYEKDQYFSIDTQAPLVRCWERVFEVPESLLEDEGAATKVYSSWRHKTPLGEDPFSYMDESPLADGHLEHAGRPTSSTLKRRTASPV